MDAITIAVAERRLALVRLDYVPLPLFGKAPPEYGKHGARKGFAGWQNLHGVNAEMIRMWQLTWPTALNTGILTAHVPTLDIDVLDEDAAAAAENLAQERFEERGWWLSRVGLWPKRAIPFRTDVPFPKITVVLVAPNGEKHKVEFLCDRQQVVVHGIHPDINMPYRWFGGEPWAIPRSELPYIHADEARQLVEDIVALLEREHGFCLATLSTARAASAPSNGNKLASLASLGTTDCGTLATNILTGADYHASLRDLALRIMRGVEPGGAVNLLRALMDASTGQHDDRWKARRAEIVHAVNSAEKLIEAQRQMTAD
jgi:hypothetical protein